MLRYVAACEHGSWHLELMKKGEDKVSLVLPFCCKSWRHHGACCLWKGAQDFRRISEAINSRDDWVYCVLTYPQSEYWDWKVQYTDSGKDWSKLRCRLRRIYGKFPYIQTWERHRKQGIHVNLLIGNSDIGETARKVDGRWESELLELHAVASGFGPIHWCQPLISGSGNKISGYLVKLARELVGVASKSQIPYDAPPHFRRLRASVGLLPKPFKSNMTGRLVMSPIIDQFGEILPHPS